MSTKNEDYTDVMPAGSLPPVEDNSNPERTNEPAKGAEIPEKFAGKSPEDLIKSYQELEKEHGRLGTEVGSLRQQQAFSQKQTELLLNQLQALQNQGDAGADKGKGDDFDSQIAQLTSDVESGDIDIASAIRKTAELTAGRAGLVAEQKIKEIMQNTKAQDVRDKFISSNPDFTTLQQTGQLAAIRAENPLHDDFSAYHELKRREAVSALETATKTALEQGRQEGAKLAAGADAAGRVLGKAGGSPRQTTNTKPANEGERIAGMMDVLSKIRGA